MPDLKVKLRRFEVPNRVEMRVNTGDSPSFPLSEVDTATLSDLCDDFRREVFRKAGRVDPRGRE